MAGDIRLGHDQSSDDRLAVAHRFGGRRPQPRRGPGRGREQRPCRVPRAQHHRRQRVDVLGECGRQPAAVGADRPRLGRPGRRGDAEAPAVLGEPHADPLPPGQRRRHQLRDAEELGGVLLQPGLRQCGEGDLPGHADPLRPGAHHRQHRLAGRPALRAGGPGGSRIVGQPRRREDPQGQQQQRQSRRRQRQRRQPGQLLGEPRERPPAVDRGRPRLLGPGGPGRPAPPRRLGGAQPDAEAPGLRQRHGVHRPHRLQGLPLRRGGRAVGDDLLRSHDHPVRPRPGHRQLRQLLRPVGRAGGLRPRDRRHPGPDRTGRPGVHRARHRPDPADLEGLHGQHRRHRLRRLREQHPAGLRRGQRHHVHRHPARRADGLLLRARQGRGGQRLAQQQHRRPHR